MIEVPQNIEAEKGLIGAIIINPNALYTLSTNPDEFHIHRHRWIWQAFLALRKRNVPIDYLTITDELNKQGQLEEIGGPAYITKLVSSSPSSLHAESYAEIVKDTHLRRQTIEIANDLVHAAYNTKDNILTDRVTAAQELVKISGSKGAVHIKEWASDIFDDIGEWQKAPRLTAGISTGFKNLDKVCGDGLMPGITLLGGRPGQGKSILAQNIAENIANRGIPGVFYTAEMQPQDFMLRVMSKRTGIKVSDFYKGNVGDNGKVLQAYTELERLPLFVDSPRGILCAELRADLTRLKAQHDIQWMVFDYLELLGDRYPHAKKWERSEELIRELVIMAKDLDLKALVIQKLNKDGWKGDVDLSHFSGGGDVAYDVVNALVLVEDTERVGNWRAVISVKDQRLVEETKSSCILKKDKSLPIFTEPKTINLNEIL